MEYSDIVGLIGQSDQNEPNEPNEPNTYRYNPGTLKYEGACIASLDPKTNSLTKIAYSTNVKPSIEPGYGEALYFIDNEWVIKDEYVNGVFYKKSTGEMADKIKVKDLDLYTEIQPMLPIKEGDQIEYIENGWSYKVKGEETSLIEAKQIKAAQMRNFFTTSARVMQIKNGAVQNIIVDQDFANNINSALKQAQESGVYFHRLRNNQGNVIIGENGLPILIKITLDGLNKISNKIELRRGYCACAEIYHRTKINLLTSVAEIENYNYLTDDLGNPYQAASAIILNEEGDVL